jgi:hypothetical protein
MHPDSLGRSVALALVRLTLGVSAGLLVATLLGVEGLTRKVLILQASMPVGVLNYLFAHRYGRSPEQVASLVLVSTLLAKHDTTTSSPENGARRACSQLGAPSPRLHTSTHG